MNIYLLEKENCSTWAVLSKDKATASKLVTERTGPFIPKGAVGLSYLPEPEFEGYIVRKFIDGEDGKLIRSISVIKEIYYYGKSDNPKRIYRIGVYIPTELV